MKYGIKQLIIIVCIYILFLLSGNRHTILVNNPTVLCVCGTRVIMQRVFTSKDDVPEYMETDGQLFTPVQNLKLLQGCYQENVYTFGR